MKEYIQGEREGGEGRREGSRGGPKDNLTAMLVSDIWEHRGTFVLLLLASFSSRGALGRLTGCGDSQVVGPAPLARSETVIFFFLILEPVTSTCVSA